MTAVLSTRVKIAGALLLLPVTASVVQLARFQIWPSQERRSCTAHHSRSRAILRLPRPCLRPQWAPAGGNLSHFRVYLCELPELSVG